jgi:hypothetical protein
MSGTAARPSPSRSLDRAHAQIAPTLTQDTHTELWSDAETSPTESGWGLSRLKTPTASNLRPNAPALPVLDATWATVRAFEYGSMKQLWAALVSGGGSARDGKEGVNGSSPLEGSACRHLVLEVRDAGRLDRPDLLELDLGASEVVEEAGAAAEQHRNDVELELVQEPRR